MLLSLRFPWLSKGWFCGLKFSLFLRLKKATALTSASMVIDTSDLSLKYWRELMVGTWVLKDETESGFLGFRSCREEVAFEIDISSTKLFWDPSAI